VRCARRTHRPETGRRAPPSGRPLHARDILSVVFVGTSEFAAAVLERLAGSETHRPALVITRPDRRSGRGRRMSPPPVAERAKALGIPVEQPASVNDPQARALIAQAGRAPAAAGEGTGGADEARQTIVVCAYGALIKEPLLSEHDFLNVHPSLLPRWRGAAPIERALMAGDADTGVSIMRLTAGLDSGPVCLAGVEPIRPQDTYRSLSARLQTLGGELLLRALAESPPFLEQPEEGVTYAEKIGPEDRLLDPGRPAVALERVVRALHPHIGARVALADGTLLGVPSAAIVSGDTEEAGASGAAEAAAPGLHARDGRLLLDCSPGVLELLTVQPPGGRAMDAAAYLRGHPAPGRR
jgi:methionyl-tRNA formyltransferase